MEGMDPTKSVYLTSLSSGGACLESSRTNEDIAKKSKKVNLSSMYDARDPGMFSSDCICQCKERSPNSSNAINPNM